MVKIAAVTQVWLAKKNIPIYFMKTNTDNYNLIGQWNKVSKSNPVCNKTLYIIQYKRPDSNVNFHMIF